MNFGNVGFVLFIIFEGITFSEFLQGVKGGSMAEFAG
jgi:hypothetical protein